MGGNKVDGRDMEVQDAMRVEEKTKQVVCLEMSEITQLGELFSPAS